MSSSPEEKVKLTDEQQKEVERQLAIIQRGVADIVPQDELVRLFERSVVTGVPLKVKLGLDPSAPDLHVGHTVFFTSSANFRN